MILRLEFSLYSDIGADKDEMAVKTTSISISTRGNADVQDITGEVAEAVTQSGLTSGTLTVFCPSSTSG